jgi:hypothetical protein
MEGWTYSDLETLIGQDEGGVGGSELGGRHYCWCVEVGGKVRCQRRFFTLRTSSLRRWISLY